MGEASDFIDNLYNQFSALEKKLRIILREEKVLKENMLVKSGILFRKYSISNFVLNFKFELVKTFFAFFEYLAV